MGQRRLTAGAESVRPPVGTGAIEGRHESPGDPQPPTPGPAPSPPAESNFLSVDRVDIADARSPSSCSSCRITANMSDWEKLWDAFWGDVDPRHVLGFIVVCIMIGYVSAGGC